MKDISSTGSFIDFTLENFIYVDKTEYIQKLVKQKSVFISRPRRFGKSLTLDTIATLFETGVEPYFKGTWIYDKWTEPTYPVFALGCPSMGNETLEETYMEDFVTEVESFASGKKIGLFGSYGWGDGEWMRNWVARMEEAGAQVYGGEDAICMNEPDSEAEEKLEALGKELAAL